MAAVAIVQPTAEQARVARGSDMDGGAFVVLGVQCLLSEQQSHGRNP